nr:hypothetical protein [Candidatus Sigynarchaeota archaeon]
IIKLPKPFEKRTQFQSIERLPRWPEEIKEIACRDATLIWKRQLDSDTARKVGVLWSSSEALTFLYPFIPTRYPSYNFYIYTLVRAWLKTRIIKYAQSIDREQILLPQSSIKPDPESFQREAEEIKKKTDDINRREADIRAYIDTLMQEALGRNCPLPCDAWESPIERSFDPKYGFEVARERCNGYYSVFSTCCIVPSCCACRVIGQRDIECISRCFTNETFEVFLKKHVESSFNALSREERTPRHGVKAEIGRIRSSIRREMKAQNLPWEKVVQRKRGPWNTRGQVALDGHVVDSRPELILDDWLFKRSIPHVRPLPCHAASIPFYPGLGSRRPDFVLSDCYIEYLGLEGARFNDYDEISRNKSRVADEKGINLVTISFPSSEYPLNWKAWRLGGNYRDRFLDKYTHLTSRRRKQSPS